MSQSADTLILGKLEVKSGILGKWKPHYYLLIGQEMFVSDSPLASNPTLFATISSKTKIELNDSKKEPTFYIEDESHTKTVFRSNPAEVYSWVYALRSCQLDKNEKGVKFSMNQFRIISVLGRGFYGKVMLVEKLDTGDLFALKSISKAKVKSELKTVVCERNILGSIPRHPFIVNLEFAFQTEKKFYFGLEYAAGGELLLHLRSLGDFAVEDVKLYIAEIALALSHLHKNQIVYRDLKPENVLISGDGHIKLTDFGLAKKLKKGTTHSFVGTPEYLAPEVVMKTEYSFPVDWWSLGILIYEILFQATPFLR